MLAPDLTHNFTGQRFAVRPQRNNDLWMEVVGSTPKTITVQFTTGVPVLDRNPRTRTLRLRKDGSYRLADNEHWLMFTNIDPTTPQPAPVIEVGTLNCTDCGIEVTYNDAGFTPWLGVDGTDICPAQSTDRLYPHRIWAKDAEKVYAKFQQDTGQKARHAL